MPIVETSTPPGTPAPIGPKPALRLTRDRGQPRLI